MKKLDKKLDRYLDKLARHWMYGVGTDGKVTETRVKIKQSILKAIMEKSLKTTESHDNCSCNQCMYVRFRNRNLEEFESVIKEVLTK